MTGLVETWTLQKSHQREKVRMVIVKRLGYQEQFTCNILKQTEAKAVPFHVFKK